MRCGVTIGADEPTAFPSQLIKTIPGEIVFFGPDVPAPRGGTWSILVPIEPFSADDEYAKEWSRDGRSLHRVHTSQARLDRHARRRSRRTR